MASKRKSMRLLMMFGFATITVVAFQNCGQFEPLALAEKTSELASSTPGDVNDPPAPGAPLPPNAPPDYNSDIFSRIGLKLGPRGNSSCQLQPPVIPAFDQASDGPNVFKVCQDTSAEMACPYKTISAAVAAAPAGSIIAVKAGTYNECVRITKDNITLQGRGGRPIVQAWDCLEAAWSKAVIGVIATNTKIENLEITDPTGDSAIAIGMGKGGGNITVHNVFMHHASGGLLTVLAGDIVVTNSYLDNLGHKEGDDPHTTPALNVALKSRSGTIRNVTITHPMREGGTLSIASLKGTVDCVVLADLDGSKSGNLLQNQYGFDLSVTNSTLQHSALSGPQMMLYWDRTSEPVPYQFTSKNNIFISDASVGDRNMLRLMGDVVPLTITDNTFIGPNSSKYSVFPDSKYYENRAAAGLAAGILPYPGATLAAP